MDNNIGTDRGTYAGLERRDFLRYGGIAGAAVGMGLGLTGCSGGGATGSGGAGGPITANLALTLSSGFDPMNASSAVATAVNQHVFEGLIDLDLITWRPYPALAKEQPKPSDDGRTWTAELRDGAKFSDGSPVTAADVAWSFNRAIDPDNEALIAPFLAFLDHVTADGRDTVKFHLKNPFNLFVQRISVVKIVPKPRTRDDAASKKFDTRPIGSGPFTVVSANSTSGVVMGVNKRYNGPRPAKAPKVTLHTTPDDTARTNDLQGGQAQAIESVPYLNVAGIKEEFAVAEKQAFNHLFLMFNCRAEPFDDKRVRQALHYAIDTDKLIKTALQGYGTAATSYLDQGNAGYQRAATVYGHDPAKAKRLLAAAGATNLSFELVTTDTGFIKDSAPVIIDAWKQIGVQATLNTKPSSAVYGELVASDSFRVLAASGDPTVYGPDVDLLLRWFYYGKIWPVDRARWTNAAAKKAGGLIDKAAAETGEKQKKLWKQALDLIADEVPLYPVFHTKQITAWDDKTLSGFQGPPTTGLYFLGASRKG